MPRGRVAERNRKSNIGHTRKSKKAGKSMMSYKDSTVEGAAGPSPSVSATSAATATDADRDTQRIASASTIALASLTTAPKITKPQKLSKEKIARNRYVDGRIQGLKNELESLARIREQACHLLHLCMTPGDGGLVLPPPPPPGALTIENTEHDYISQVAESFPRLSEAQMQKIKEDAEMMRINFMDPE